MKKAIIFAAMMLFPVSGMAQSFDSVDACKSLRNEVSAAVEAAKPLETLLVSEQVTESEYLAQLYEGVKVLSKSGEMFFKASDSHESACKTILTQGEKQGELRQIYEWYLEPVRAAYQFFKRAREAAVKLNRQSDVDMFSSTMTEYDAAVMKLVGVCESDLAGTEYAKGCASLSTRLGDALR